MREVGNNDGFYWFVGRVEDVNDPEQLGRVRVRILYHHTDNKSLLPTEDLPWAIPLMPPFSAGANQVGLSPVGLIINSMVVGFFADGAEKQMPIILGSFAGIPEGNRKQHDVPSEARGQDSTIKDKLGPEPSPSFNAKYPFNMAFKSRSGHVVELDDTPGFERVHVYHKSGSYIEIQPDGKVVAKSVGEKYDIVNGEHQMYSKGKTKIRGSKVVITNDEENLYDILSNILDVLGNVINGNNWKGNLGAPLIYVKQLQDSVQVIRTKLSNSSLFKD